MRGHFIALYGINNIGKSTQTNLLVQKMLASGIRVEYVKYPIYDLDPTGKKLNEILRGKQKTPTQAVMNFFSGTKVRRPTARRGDDSANIFRLKEIKHTELRQRVTEEELQMWYSLNRYQYDPTLKKKLDSGISVVAEDYTGTGLAWGSAKGADNEWLESVNKYLTQPDLQILMDGERFSTGREMQHIHESSDRLIHKARAQFQKLAKKYEWKVVNANQPLTDVSREIWQLVEPLFTREERREPSWLTPPQQGLPRLSSDSPAA